jgi:UDP-2,4-diacetamido-2,4,6-trideoxy-beta-L-altropyranose hydrolase
MNVVIRADASVASGHGHVMRCLTLAEELRAQGSAVRFICREQPGDLCAVIEALGFEVAQLHGALGSWHNDAAQTLAVMNASQSIADWIIVDHYELDARWEAFLAPATHGLMVIDDLANRPHCCDLLLDQNYFPEAARRYEALLPRWCKCFLGPEHVLLRREFRAAGPRPVGERPRRLLIFFGGGDPTGQSGTALAAALEFDPTLPMDVIIGSNNPRAADLESAYGHQPNVHLLRHTNDMARLMAQASLCLGAGGIATYERLHMGLPSIVVATADNQHEPLAALDALGCIEYLGDATHVSVADWVGALRRWSENGRSFPPLGIGMGIDRVIDALQTRLVPFDESHVATTFEFLRDPALRASFAMGDAPDWSAHVAYWRTKREDSSERVFAIEQRGIHVGNCGIKPVPHSADHEGWIYLSSAVKKRSGLGEFAFRRLMRIAFRELGHASMVLHVRHDNEVALGLYEKIGFVPDDTPVDCRVWGVHAGQMRRLVIAR